MQPNMLNASELEKRKTLAQGISKLLISQLNAIDDIQLLLMAITVLLLSP